jgi:quinol monooxygenase YgiN
MVKRYLRQGAMLAGSLAVSATMACGQLPGDTRDGSSPMVMTVLEAQVAPARWDALRESYEAHARLPESGVIVESFLIQSNEDSNTWRIVTVWRDREALDVMRRSGETPAGILIFGDANAEPRLTIFTVWANPRATLGSAP